MSPAKRLYLTAAIIAVVALGAIALWRSGIVSLGSSGGETDTDLRSLADLPYTNVVVEPGERKEKTGVVLYDEQRSYSGVNLYCNHYDKRTGAYLLDMNGEVVHQWHYADSSLWKLVRTDKDGNVYGVIHEYEGDEGQLVKMDWNSKIFWEIRGQFHHDIQFLPDGSILTLSRRPLNVQRSPRGVRILNDLLVFLTPDGKITHTTALFGAVRNLPATQRALDKAAGAKRYRGFFDIMHTNTAAYMPRDIPGFCRKGNILICMRNLDLIFVYDIEKREIVWQHQGDDVWQHPHEPTLLPNDNLLIFDNGYKRGWSRVIEVNPATMEIVWEYKGDPPESFYTEYRGSIQRLPNGNTLITESDTGRAFEVTHDGTMVWEWYNPLFSAEGRSIVFKMKRLETGVVDVWMSADARR